MSSYYPKIAYPAVSPTTTLNFTLPPVKKPGPYPVADQEGVGTASIALGGQKQVMRWRTDQFFHLIMDDVPWADMPAWQAFIDYALEGNSFLYYPDATGTNYDEYWLEDSGGSARNQSSNSQLDAWNPKMGDKQHGQFELVLRKVPGGQTMATAIFTASSPVISAPNSFEVNQGIQFSTTGTLPLPFAPLTVYYVIATGLSYSQFEVSTTIGGAAITATTAGSGTQSVFNA
jgi:hypothetical protein